ncbi:orotidine 5'-phosphate decarboxylase [candidate division WOR-1 bacterium RIFCSPHIGHO2_01_FULL_53_15]|uniref:Orotidine 5'-phosphate decarboxylase n=1 Tax=candidate division WOR-1 bacterium RIFCSPHIGHO2_01_FULL_53_15 TaxID=1802564 RepID=A0A1F4Q144_UNCSA|nr:MAG: orotidine 5'-phosphate decarboxylase [candidate division WOR-1 bacterium RIFCSPHIGHO2_01_FULL_53_15]OGC10875.1 MAG: orotidine 5'-phosphate decarboxylase [candidate division WOR-1 bacterium RIFCSPHIGHO2_02_FULL_53_26]
MKFSEQLSRAAAKNNSLLCVGLDIDLSRIPQKFLTTNDPIFLFNKEIVDATKNLVCAYKPNSAFYEMYGLYGLSSLIKTIDYIHESDLPVILDAKRGDVGHSSNAYAKSAFEVFKADAVTVNPYMGHDSVQPFLDYREKGIFVLCLTSNPGFRDFQTYGCGEPLYKTVVQHVKEWNHYGNCGLVVGATKPTEIKEIRKLAGEMPFLIPGVGAQGGDLGLAVKYSGKNSIINASRSILYADEPGQAAKKLRDEINKFR